MTDLAELKQRHSKIAQFITSSDKEGRLCLLPYPDFLEKYSIHSNEEKILLLYEFDELLETGEISTEYLLKEWKKIKFGSFISSMTKSIENRYFSESRLRFTSEVQGKLTSTINSNISIGEKIITLSNLKKNYIRYYGTKQFDHDVLFNNIEIELNHLKEIQTQELLTFKKEYQIKIDEESQGSESENLHPRIFPNGKCWQLFEYWKENAKNENIKADLCFIYWQMKADKLMYDITPKQFTEWLLNKLQFDFEGYWKQLDRVKTTNRNRLYSMAKLQFQLNKSQY